MKDSKTLIYRADVIKEILEEMQEENISIVIKLTRPVEGRNRSDISRIELYTVLESENNQASSQHAIQEPFRDMYGFPVHDAPKNSISKYDFKNIGGLYQDIYYGVFDIIAPIIQDEQYPHKEILTDVLQEQKYCWTIYASDHPEVFKQVHNLVKTVQENDRDAIEHNLNSTAQREIDKYEQELNEYRKGEHITSFAEDVLKDLENIDATKEVMYRAYEDSREVSDISFHIDKRENRSAPPRVEYDEYYEEFYLQDCDYDEYYGYGFPYSSDPTLFLEMFDILKPIIADENYEDREIVLEDHGVTIVCYMWTIREDDNPDVFQKLRTLFRTIVEE